MNLFYLSGNTTGGWVTYTAHLMLGLIDHCQPRLYKVGNRSEQKCRPFGYNEQYRNVSVDEAVSLCGSSPSVIVAIQKNYREIAAQLLGAGAWIVVHDPTEFVNLKLSSSKKIIAIRKVTAQKLKCNLIRHPYSRRFKTPPPPTVPVHACSIARIDFDKNTTIILDANRLLPERKKVQIHGFENRLYTKFKVCPHYPEWEQSKLAYPRELRSAVDICRQSRFTVDLSLIKGDGGGTQYSFLEAMDAGSVNILHHGWILPNDEMIPIKTCLTVTDGESLAELLNNDIKESLKFKIRENCNLLLEKHDASQIAHEFYQTITG